jgi:TetR/AcrR family transcriptional regulator, regulator of autoinduction and epiphytic fitness
VVRRGATGARPGQARTRLARAAFVGAARELFLDRGYGATTMEAISEAADVPPATVYRLFASKIGILKALLDVSIVGDDEDVAVTDRPEVRSMLSEEDAGAQLAGFVRLTMEINGRTAPVYRILESAAASDPEAGPLLDELTRQRTQGQRTITRSLARRGALRAGLRERDAADLIHALASPELYRLLVVDREWKVERYERWLCETLCSQLLPSLAI